MHAGKIALTITLVLIAAIVANCASINPILYPKQWYNNSYEPAANTSVYIEALALGSTPITILDSDTDEIKIAINYYTGPEFVQRKTDDRLNVYAFVLYKNDMTQNVGADILVYLPKYGNYTVNVYNQYLEANNDKKGSGTSVNVTNENVTVWVNDRDHPVPMSPQNI